MSSESIVFDFLKTLAHNLNVIKQGKRYEPSQCLLYDSVSYMFVPKAVSSLASNLCGPDSHKIYGWRKQNELHVTGSLEENFKLIDRMYREIADKQWTSPSNNGRG